MSKLSQCGYSNKYDWHCHLTFAQNSGGPKPLKSPCEAGQHWFCEGMRRLELQLHDLPLCDYDFARNRLELFDHSVQAGSREGRVAAESLTGPGQEIVGQGR